MEASPVCAQIITTPAIFEDGRPAMRRDLAGSRACKRAQTSEPNVLAFESNILVLT